MANELVSPQAFNMVLAKLTSLEDKIDRRHDELRADLGRRFDEINKRIDDESVKARLLELRLGELEKGRDAIKNRVTWAINIVGSLFLTAAVTALYNWIKRPGSLP
jgi:hypothetical protein